ARGSDRGAIARRARSAPPRARARRSQRARRRRLRWEGGRTWRRGWGLEASCSRAADRFSLTQLAPIPQPLEPSTYARLLVAASFACFAMDAKAAGLLTASSARLFRSSVTPALFRPLISCP